MNKRADEGVSPIIAAVLIVGLIVILAAIVAPVAINTISNFAVQEKSTVGVTVQISADDSMTVNIVNGKDVNELKDYTAMVYFKNKDPMFFDPVSVKSSGMQSNSFPIDVDNAVELIIVGAFSDGHSEVIFSGTIQPGYIVVPGGSSGTCEVEYWIGSNNIRTDHVFVIGRNPANYVPEVLPSGASGIGWYSDSACENPWTRLTNSADAGKTIKLYGKYLYNTRIITIEYWLEPLSGLTRTHDDGQDATYQCDAGLSDSSVLSSVEFLTAVGNNVPTGFYVPEQDLSITSGVVKVNCDRRGYQVTYVITSADNPAGFTPNYQDNTYTKTDSNPAKYGSEVTICPNLTATGDKKEYYTFSGWSSTAVNADEIKAGTFTMGAESVVFTGSWSKTDEVTVKFNAKGHGGPAPNQVTVPKGNNLSAYSSITGWNPTVTGYTFNGWFNNSAAADNTSVLAWDTAYGWKKWNLATEPVMEDTNLYANWVADVYDIKYLDKGSTSAYSGGSTDSYPKKHTYGTVTELPSPANAPSGKYFAGWEDASGNPIDMIGSTVQPASGSTINVYAKWETESGNTIYYHPNVKNGDVSGKETERVILRTKGGETKRTVAGTETGLRYTQTYSGTPVVLTASQFTVMDIYDKESDSTFKNHKFCGWVKASGAEAAESAYSATYADGASISTTGAAVHLYAVWAREFVTIELDPNDGTIAGHSPDEMVNVYAKLKDSKAYYPENLPVPTRTGYDFAGWKQSSTAIAGANGAVSGSPKQISGIVSSKVTLTAQWTPHTYSISYDYNGGEKKTGVTNAGSAKYNDVVGVEAPKTRSDYIFAGWTVTSGYGSMTGDAKYGTTSSPGTAVSYNVLCGNAAASSDVGKLYFTSLSPNNGDTVTLKAQWIEKDKYVTVRYNGNKADETWNSWFGLLASGKTTLTEGSMPSYNTIGSQKLPVDLKKNEYAMSSTQRVFLSTEKTNYVFVGWSKSSGQSNSAIYADGARLPTSTGENLNLYASWVDYDASKSESGYAITVTLNANGGTIPSGVSQVKVKKSSTPSWLYFPVAEKTGKTFNGWYTSSSGGTQVVDGKGNVVSASQFNKASGFTLYAHWT